MFPGGKPPMEDFIGSWYPIIIAVIIGCIVAFRNYMKGCPNPCTEKMEGKVVIVTGANSGMGKEVAKDMALRGARVYLACRNMERGKDAAKEISDACKGKNKKIAVLELDLGNLKSVSDFVTTFKKAETKLDLLVNNAGMMGNHVLTLDGNELTFQVNYLGPFILTHLLLDSLLAAPAARIINVACHAYGIGEINWEDLNHEKVEEFKSGEMYAQSKAALVMFTRQMARYLEGTKVTCNAVNPGIVNTMLYRHIPLKNNPFFRYTFGPLTWLMMKPAKDGAQTAMYCSVSPDEEGVSGKVYNECRITPISGVAADDDAVKKLWDLSFKLAGIEAPEELQAAD